MDSRDCSHRVRFHWRVYTRLAFLLWLSGATVACSGCTNRASKFVPAPQVAQRALADALDAWQAGQPSGPVDKTSPLVHVTDNLRKSNQRLVAYKILGEKPTNHGRAFIVQLDLESPSENLKAEYIVVGIDPLWVFRREDYELLMHWDHHMAPIAKESAKDSAKDTKNNSGDNKDSIKR